MKGIFYVKVGRVNQTLRQGILRLVMDDGKGYGVMTSLQRSKAIVMVRSNPASSSHYGPLCNWHGE